MDQSSAKISDFQSRFWPIWDRCFDKEFPEFDWDIFVFLRRPWEKTLNLVKCGLCKGGKGRVPVLVRQVWYRQSTCTTWYRHMVQTRCLYQTCPNGTGKGQETTVHCPKDRSYTHAGGLSLSQGQTLHPRWSLSQSHPAQPVPTCPIKWTTRAWKFGWKFWQS